MKINFENLECVYNEWTYAEEDYRHSSARYFKEHGYGVRLDLAKTEEERHIAYAYHERDRFYEAVWAVLSVLDLDSEQRDRFYSAFRAVRKWYEKNQWKDCLKRATEERLIEYIFG